MITFNNISKRLETIVAKRSKEITQREFERVRSKFVNTLREWKTEVRMLLSTPHIAGMPNISKYPQMRSGGLRKSLSYRTSVSHTPNSTKFKLTATTLWDTDPSRFTTTGPTGVDYGSILNSDSKRFGDKSFFGWRDRTQDLLKKRIRSAIK